MWPWNWLNLPFMKIWMTYIVSLRLWGGVQNHRTSMHITKGMMTVHVRVTQSVEHNFLTLYWHMFIQVRKCLILCLTKTLGVSFLLLDWTTTVLQQSQRKPWCQVFRYYNERNQRMRNVADPFQSKVASRWSCTGLYKTDIAHRNYFPVWTTHVSVSP